jgi:putative transport protein
MFSIVISVGLYFGKLKFRGFSLGPTAVLFSGLIFGYLGVEINPDMMTFVRNFGLLLFVFFIGLQIGPSFFATFKSGGVRLNLLMVLGVLLSLAITIIYYLLFSKYLTFAEILGVLFGAVTSSPGFGATQEILPTATERANIALSYACAYPLAILGAIGVILFIRRIFKIDMAQEDAAWIEQQKQKNTCPIYYHVTVTNKAIDGLTLKDIRDTIGRPFICSRILHNGVIKSPNAHSEIRLGDKLRIVSTPEHRFAVTAFCGEDDPNIDLATEHSPLITRFILVTEEKMNGVRIEDLHLSRYDGVNITRVTRAGVTFFPYNSLRLQIGDTLCCVGPQNSVNRLATLMGNREKELERPNVMAIFAGIAFAIILGAFPIAIPGMSAPIQLGVAGGALIAAILLGYYGPRFHLVTYTTNSANLMLREWGQTFFLSAIGIGAGVPFFNAFLGGKGFIYLALSIPITVIPMLVIGVIARVKLKCNFHTIAGLIAGSSTNSALMGFCARMSSNSTAVVAYSSIYPLAMFLRIISGQLLLMSLWLFTS